MIWSSSIQLTELCISSERAAKEQRKSSERAAKELECHLLSIGSNLPSVIRVGSQGRILPESSNQEYHGGPYACCVTLRVTSFAGSFRVFASTEWILAVYWVCLPTCGDTDLQRLQALADTGHTHTAHTATAVHSTRWAMLGVCSDLGPALLVEVPVLSTSQHPAPRFSLDGHSLDLSFDDSQCFALLSSSIYYELLWLPRGLDTNQTIWTSEKKNIESLLC